MSQPPETAAPSATHPPSNIRDRMSPRWLSGLADGSGFAFSAIAVQAIACTQWSTTTERLVHISVLAWLVAAIAGLCSHRSKAFWISFYVASVTLVALFLGHRWPVGVQPFDPSALLLHALPFLLLNIAALLAAYRIHPIWYGLLVVAIAAANASIYGVILGLVTASIIAALLVTLNYGIQFFHDHSWERMQWRQSGTLFKAVRILSRSILPWLVAVGLVGAGALLLNRLQDAATLHFYANAPIRISPDATQLDLEVDTLYTLDRREEVDLSLTYAEIQKGAKDLNTAYDETPRLVDARIGSFRPPALSDAICDGFHWTIRWILAPICKWAVSSINDMIGRIFDTIRAETASYLDARVAALQSANNRSADALQAAAADAIERHYANLRSAVTYVAFYVDVLSWTSLVYLIGTLFAAFQWFVCRVAFDGLGPTFRVSRDQRPAEPIQITSTQKVMVNDLPASTWYFSRRGLNLKGDGLAESLVPVLDRCALARLFAGKLLMSKSTVPVTVVRKPPQASVDTPKSLVVMKLLPQQRVVFRLNDLAAHCDRINFRRAYSAHSSTNLLGIGRFYTFAEGPGNLLLFATGEVQALENGSTVDAADLLAWDGRTEFSLDQASTGLGMWVNDPRICVRTHGSTAVAQSIRGDGPSMFVKLWRLLRFVAVSW